MPTRIRAVPPTTSASSCSSALVGVSARWAWKRRRRIELSLYAVLGAATVLGFALDDTDLRHLLRVRHPVDVATGRDVGCSQRVVVLAHMAGAGGRRPWQPRSPARRDDGDHRCRGVLGRRHRSRCRARIRSRGAVRTRQCADRCPVGSTRCAPSTRASGIRSTSSTP